MSESHLCEPIALVLEPASYKQNAAVVDNVAAKNNP